MCAASIPIVAIRCLSGVALAFVLASTGLAQNRTTKADAPAVAFKKIHNFDFVNGVNVYDGLIADAAGNFYGTGGGGGAHDEGVVYELSSTPIGGWNERVLYSFGSVTGDGMYPRAKVTMDASGNLYGTTPLGGAFGQGTVFQLVPSSSGNWTETVLHSFGGNASDGITPYAGVVIDSAGNLYGTTSAGGMHNDGTAYELTPVSGGGWAETMLHAFGSDQEDGLFPLGELVLDVQGNLYGTTASGGKNFGTVFELSPAGGGAWTETILHSFLYREGGDPTTAVTFDVSGNLFVSLPIGGMGPHSAAGSIYELSPNSGGWTGTVLYYFHGTRANYPVSSVAIDGFGNLFVSTGGGVSTGCCGAVVELTPAGDGTWNETILHDFHGPDGYGPNGNLLMDASGHIYGTTFFGGSYNGDVCDDYGCGVVFEITP